MSRESGRRAWYRKLYQAIERQKREAPRPALNDEGLAACPNPKCRSLEGPTVHYDDYWEQHAGTCSICGTRGAVVSIHEGDGMTEGPARALARGNWNALPRAMPSTDEPKGKV